MPATKRGIYHNLKESSYAVSNKEIAFFFSSKFYLNKFLIEYKEHRTLYTDRLKDEKPVLNLDILADIHLYVTIEKRGFRSRLKGVDITCEQLHRYALRKMTEPNTPDWFATPNQRLTAREKIMV